MTARVVDGIAKTGKPVQGFAIEQHGDIETIASASRVAKDFLQAASEARREECPISDLWVSHKCGESDTTSGMGANPTVGNFIDKTDAIWVTNCFGETSEITGAEHLCRERAINKEVGDKWFATWEAYMNEVIEPNKTSDLSESQPTKGNIEGGLTTIEEKAMGNLQKIGKNARYIDVLAQAETPNKGAGLYYMDTSSAAAECVTLQAAGGFAVHIFPTGQGNIIGNPIEPVIKVTANPRTVRTMGEHVDLDVSGLLRREMNLDQAGDALIDMVIRTCNGRLTAAEALGHREFVMTKLYTGSSNADYHSWSIYDNVRITGNPNHSPLYANRSHAEGKRGNTAGDSGGDILHVDFLSNGFKCRANGTELNGTSSDKFIYMAFAEQPYEFATSR